MVPYASGDPGVNVTFPPEAETAPGTAVAPFFNVNVAVVRVSGSMASLNVAATEVFTATPVVPLAGDTDVTVGGVVSGAAAEVKDQL